LLLLIAFFYGIAVFIDIGRKNGNNFFHNFSNKSQLARVVKVKASVKALMREVGLPLHLQAGNDT
jgi:hypothetical protein